MIHRKSTLSKVEVAASTRLQLKSVESALLITAQLLQQHPPSYHRFLASYPPCLRSFNQFQRPLSAWLRSQQSNWLSSLA